jgi:tetraacyldisaccharide 4'-kinase
LQHLRPARDIEIAVLTDIALAMAAVAGRSLCEPVSRLNDVDWRVVNGEPQSGELVMTLAETGLCRVNAPTPMPRQVRFGVKQQHCRCIAIQHVFLPPAAAGAECYRHSFPDHYWPPDVRFGDGLAVIMTQKDA